MNHDPKLNEMMNRQADAFNRNAPEWERVAIFMEVQQYQMAHRGEG